MGPEDGLGVREQRLVIQRRPLVHGQGDAVPTAGGAQLGVIGAQGAVFDGPRHVRMAALKEFPQFAETGGTSGGGHGELHLHKPFRTNRGEHPVGPVHPLEVAPRRTVKLGSLRGTGVGVEGFGEAAIRVR